MNRIFLFDLGNVLAKPINDFNLYSKLDCKISYEDFLDYWWNNDLVIKAHMGLISDEEHINSLLNFCKSSLSLEEFLNIYNNMDKSLYGDTIEYINSLKDKGYKVGILSNLRLMDFNRYKDQLYQIGFDYYFLSYEMKNIKPSKEIYIDVINKLKCKSNEIVFYDDKLENIKAARELGINAFQVTGDNIKSYIKWG